VSGESYTIALTEETYTLQYSREAGPQGPAGEGGAGGLGDTISLTDGEDITVALQEALDDATIPVIRLMTPGTYYVSPDTVNPYWVADTSYTCFTITRNDLTIVIGPGVTLKLAANSHTDAKGFVYMFVCRSRDNIKFTGGGKLDMDSINMPYTVGYNQESGGHIRGFFQHVVAYDGNTNITVEDLTLDNTFGNPVNMYCQYPATGTNNIVYRNLRCTTFGEGLQIVGAKNASIENCYAYDPLDVARGDGYEFSACDGFSCINNYIRGSGNGGDQGSAIDIYSSINGEVHGNHIVGWNDGIGCYFAVGSPRVQNVTVSNNRFIGLRGGTSLSAGLNVVFQNNHWIDIVLSPPMQSGEIAWASMTATASGTTITVTIASHGFQTGELITIRGANETGCNGTFKVTRLTANTLTYTATSAPGGNPTGTLQYRHARQMFRVSDTFINCANVFILGDYDFDFTGSTFQGAEPPSQHTHPLRSLDQDPLKTYFPPVGRISW